MKKEKVANSNLNRQYNVGVECYATQNKQSCVGAGTVSAQNAITLISLVVTIIVLLILAGVTINLTLGNNGIFKTAQQAAENYTEAQNKELADLNEFENIAYKVMQAPEYDPSLLKLKPGDYVKYDTGRSEVGDNGVATFRVLYDATSPYGLQIISDKNIAEVKLTAKDWEDGKTSYNNAIIKLNGEAMKYRNSTYATDARCVGSNPLNKNAEVESTVKLPPTSWPNYVRPIDWQTDDTLCRDTDTNYKIDWDTLKKEQMCITEKYWLASRIAQYDKSCLSFFVYFNRGDGILQGDRLCWLLESGTLYSCSRTNGLHPCITLKPDLTITSGDGASEDTAYTLGI